MKNFFVDIEEGLRVVAMLLTLLMVFWWAFFELKNEGSLWQPILVWHLLLYLSGYYDGWSER